MFGIEASTASENGTLNTYNMASHSLGCPEPRPRAVLAALLPSMAISNMEQYYVLRQRSHQQEKLTITDVH